MIMRLLLTGFEPFGGETINPSAEILQSLAADPPRGIELSTLKLPVRGRVSFELLLPELYGGDFDAWLGLGQAGGRERLSVERVGINVLIDRDDEHAILDEALLVEDGPAAYFSRLPVQDLAARLSEAGAAAAVSNTAGTYICNELTYVVQHHLAQTGRDIPSGFIHLPYLPEQVEGKTPVKPSMALETQTLGVRAAVEFIRDLVEARAAVAAR